MESGSLGGNTVERGRIGGACTPGVHTVLSALSPVCTCGAAWLRRTQACILHGRLRSVMSAGYSRAWRPIMSGLNGEFRVPPCVHVFPRTLRMSVLCLSVASACALSVIIFDIIHP
ncbi:hypothetical protein B0H14DRAFT_3878509, partial [Mycena olivaceomarginata]